MPPPEETCSTCKFFLAGTAIPLARVVQVASSEPQTVGTVGNICRRNPPTSFPLILIGNLTFSSVFPTVTANDWCGFYEAPEDQ